MNDERQGFAKGLLVGTLIGGLIGTVLGILYAPRRGGEIREQMAVRTRKIADQFGDECARALQKSRASYESRINQLKEQESGIIRRIERLLKKVGG